jgi:hypothetical protein
VQSTIPEPRLLHYTLQSSHNHTSAASVSTLSLSFLFLFQTPQVSGKPIKFVGTGEKMDALEPFYPERMAQRILGMGDMLTLYEKAQEAIKVRAVQQQQQQGTQLAAGQAFLCWDHC